MKLRHSNKINNIPSKICISSIAIGLCAGSIVAGLTPLMSVNYHELQCLWGAEAEVSSTTKKNTRRTEGPLKPRHLLVEQVIDCPSTSDLKGLW